MPQVSYASATSHYTSPRRRDPVKRLYEEAVTTAAALAALRRATPAPATPLTIVDLGCGTGDGLDLLTSAPGCPPFTYHGVDLDPDMIATARTMHTDADATFEVGDIRSTTQKLPDVFLSFGVPFSHLTADELTDFLRDVAATVAEKNRPVVLVLDVLGRYSIEWYRHWAQQRWEYPMSFFEETDAPPTCPMTFYTPAALVRAAETASAGQPAEFTEWCFADRSPLVGRHTTAGTISPDVNRYRAHLNDLLMGCPVEPELLWFPPQRPDCPIASSSYGTLEHAWDARIATHDFAAPAGTAWTNLGMSLLATLGSSAAAGIGHTLIATTTVRPRG